MLPLFGAGESGNKRWVLESELLWSIAARALSLGVNAILDYGCWARSERGLFHVRAAELGVRFELHVLDVPVDELWRHLDARNLTLPPNTFPITRAELEEWASWYEAPGPEELRSTENPQFASRIWSFQP